MLCIFQAASTGHIHSARELFIEYATQLGHDLTFQHFAEELDNLPGAYTPPAGRLLLATHEEALVGCVALRGQSATTCEMKRLYVRPEYRGRGFGRLLATEIIAAARHIGYARMRLDTLATMSIPRALYSSLGFRKIPRYYDNPIAGVEFFELALD